jgi:predicted transcriptional regulator
MSMLRERLQVLISRDQRGRLQAAAKRRGTSVGALVREAIDDVVARAPQQQRARAVAEIRSMSGGRFFPPEALDRIVEEEREAVLPPRDGRRRR